MGGAGGKPDEMSRQRQVLECTELSGALCRLAHGAGTIVRRLLALS
jgi:hypothetical protein